MRYTNEVAFEIIRDFDFGFPDAESIADLEPLIAAFRSDMPNEEVEKVSKRIAPQVWTNDIHEECRLTLVVARHFAGEYFRHLESAVADLEKRGGRSMTARAIVDLLALNVIEAESRPGDALAA